MIRSSNIVTFYGKQIGMKLLRSVERMSESRKLKIAGMTRIELNAHAYHLENEQGEYERDLLSIEKERDELQKRVKELSDELVEWKTEAKRQYMLFNSELDITRKLREALEEADVFDPTRARFKMDANGNLTRYEDIQ